MKLLTALVLMFAVIAGCAAIDVTKTAKGFHEPTNPNDVEILRTIPGYPFEELGSVTATGFPPIETAKMYNAIRTKTAPLGASAVILSSEGIGPDGLKWATGVAILKK